MLTYPVVRATIDTLHLVVAYADPVVDGDDDEQREFLDSWFSEWYSGFRLVHRTALEWGKGVAEVIWESIDGKWLPVGVYMPHPIGVSIAMNPDRSLVVQAAGKEIPGDRAIVYIHQGDPLHLPSGVSVPQSQWWAYQRLKQVWAYAGAFLKREGIPMRIVRFPAAGQVKHGEETRPAQSVAREIGESVEGKAWAAFPRDRDATQKPVDYWDITYPNPPDVKGLFMDYIQKLENLMWLGSLVPKKLLEQEAELGSLALGRVQENTFMRAVLAHAQAWEDALRPVVNQMLIHNFGEVRVSFTLAPFSSQEREMLWEILKAKIRAGAEAVIDVPALAERLGIPTISELPEGKPGGPVRTTPIGDKPEEETDNMEDILSELDRWYLEVKHGSA